MKASPLFESTFLVVIVLIQVIWTTCSPPQEGNVIKWPNAVDEFDQHLINLARYRRDVDDEDESPPLTTTPSPKSGNTTAKNFTIDWNEVNKKWHETISEEEVGKKWADMEKGLKNGVRSLLRTIFPQVVAMSSDAKVSGNCSAGILKWIISLRHLKGWAIKMLDAIGKPSPGMLEGSATIFGNHRQCLNIRAPDDEDDFDEDAVEENAVPKFKEFFRGKYCMLELKPWLPPKKRFYGLADRIKSLERDPADDTVFKDLAEYASFLHFLAFRFDLCVPSICQREDIQRVANFIATKLDFRARVVRCEVMSDSFIELTTIQILAVLGFMGAIGIVSAATAGVWLWPILRNKSAPTIVKLVSLPRAWEEFCGVECYEKKPKLASLYGLRYFILVWIIIVEIIQVIGFGFLRDMLPYKELAMSQGAQWITNSTLQYSSLIFISAFILGYYNEGKGMWKAFKFFMRKVFRIIPVVIAGTGFMILLPLLDHTAFKGPVWGDILTNRTETCQISWWRNVFMIQNFFPPQNTCLPETWILCVELQLAAAFTVILGFMSSLRAKSKTTGWIFLGAIVVVGFVVNFAEVYLNQLPPSWYWTLPDPEGRYEYFYLHLYKPWTHLSVYAIGVGCGIFCADQRKGSSEGPYGKGVTRLIGWLFVSVLSAVLIFSQHDWVLGNLPDPLTSGLYDGLHRIAWSIGHCIMVHFLVADLDDENSISRSILGNKALITLGRLSLSAYIVHPIVELLFFGTQHSAIFSSPVSILYFAFGTLGFTYGLALFMVLFFEMPVAAIFKTRESTIVRKDEVFPKFSKPTSTYHVNPSRNGDIEMSKNPGKEQQIRL